MRSLHYRSTALIFIRYCDEERSSNLILFERLKSIMKDYTLIS